MLSKIPELDSLSRTDRFQAWNYAYIRCFRHWETYLAVGVCGLFMGTGYHLLDVFGSALGGGAGGIILSETLVWKGRRYVQEWLTLKRR